MKIDPDDFEEVLLEFVRGDAPISTLENVGILVTSDQNLTSTTITIKSGTPLIVSPNVSDIVQGLITVAKGRGLKDWANFILATDLIDLVEVEKHPQCDILLNALWDASFDGFVDNIVIAKVRSLQDNSK